MKNYRTTIIGFIGAILKFIETYQANGGNLADWKLWAIPAAIAGLGYVAKDAGVTGSVKVLVPCFCLLILPSCSTAQKVLASPFGQSVLVTAKSLAKQLEKELATAELAVVITKATQQRDALKAQSETASAGPVKDASRIAEIAGLQAVIDSAQQLYFGQTGRFFKILTSAKAPLPVIPAQS